MLLEQMETTSRSKLSALTGISLPTVSSIIKELVDEGWVKEVGDGMSRGGKPPQLIQLDAGARYICAVQMNQDQIRIWVTNLVGEMIAEERRQVITNEPKPLCEDVAKAVKALIQKSGIDSSLLLGVGVAVPGVVNDQGIVSQAPEFNWDAEPIQQLLSDALKDEVVVENDVRLAVMGEAWRKSGFTETMVYVHLSKGIGAGVLINGEIYKGAHFSAGEIGNMIVDPPAVNALLMKRDKGKDHQATFESLYGLDAYKDSLKSAKAESDWVIEYLTYGLVNIISILDPKVIVFGGEMPLMIDDFLNKVKERLSLYVAIMPELNITPLGNDAPLFGATKIVLENHRSHVTWTSIK